MTDGIEAHCGSVGPIVVFDDPYTQVATVRLQLLKGCGPERVGRGEHDTLAVIQEKTANFGDGCCLASAVDTNEQDNEWLLLSGLRNKVQWTVQALCNDVHQGPLHAIDDGTTADSAPYKRSSDLITHPLCHLESYIVLEECHLELPELIGEVLLTDLLVKDRRGES